MLALRLEWLACDLWVLSLNPVTVELTPGGVDSACHPSEVGEMGTSVLVMEGTVAQKMRQPLSSVLTNLHSCL